MVITILGSFFILVKFRPLNFGCAEEVSNKICQFVKTVTSHYIILFSRYYDLRDRALGCLSSSVALFPGYGNISLILHK